jgi:hypothetical protein
MGSASKLSLLAKVASGLTGWLQTLEKSLYGGLSSGSNLAANKLTEWQGIVNPIIGSLTNAASSVAGIASLPAAFGHEASGKVMQRATDVMTKGIDYTESGKDELAQRINNLRYTPAELQAEMYGESYLAAEKRAAAEARKRTTPKPKPKKRAKGYRPARSRN